jgi:hypothetical protein
MIPDNATVFVSARVLDELLAVAPYSQGHHAHVALLNSQVDVQYNQGRALLLLFRFGTSFCTIKFS